MAQADPIAGVPSEEGALAEVLGRLGRDVQALRTNPVVNVAGVWRLEVDALGRLVAVHGATATVTVLATPPP